MQFNQNELCQFATDLVRIPSILGHEERMAARVETEFRRLGFDEIRVDGVGNVVGVIAGTGGPGPTILFDAHMDTVGVSPEERWTHPPFSGATQGRRLYGRGASDMKGALAAMVFGLAALDRNCLRGRALVCASVGEETCEGAALEPVLMDWHPDFVVIGEATDLNLAIGGRGRAELLVAAHGVPAHASTPHRGVHAVSEMFRLIKEIEKLAAAEDPLLGRGVTCLTDIISEPFPAQSVVPSCCRATVERRLICGEGKEQVIGDFLQCGRRAGCREVTVKLAQTEYSSYTGFRISGEKWFPAWKMTLGHPLVMGALRALSGAGLNPACSAYQFCTNAALTAGRLQIPTVGFGPSSETLAHVIDEYVKLDQLAAAATGYRAIAAGMLAL